MKKPIIKAIVGVFVFILALIIISDITNKGNTDMTVEMQPATYPLVYMEHNGERINCLHGYAQKMQESYMRDSITPMGQDRVISFSVDRYKRDISKLTFEVRSVDGSRLIEETPINNFTDKEDTIQASVTLKDLINENEEYCFILILEAKDGETIRYYTRIIQTEDCYIDEKLSFVKDFHNKTFVKDDSIARYLETNAEGNNSSFYTVNIHSNYNQITWGNLNVKEKESPNITIKELGTQTASITMDYYVNENENEYHVQEYYRVRYGKERMYLLDFERSMNQIFNTDNTVFVNNKIILGIADDNIALEESDDGNVVAYVQEKSLFCYNATEKKCVNLFSFANRENNDFRDLYNQHDIKILSVEESGNVRFMVYGYMNRGRHEGNVGIQLYYYNSVLNTIEEDVFIEYDKSYALLREEMEQLSYVSKNSILYFILDGTIYSVNLDEKAGEVLVSNLGEDAFKVSEDNQMIVWQTEQEKYNCTKLILMNLNTRKHTDITAEAGTRIAPLGFMNSDVIYGIADKEDIVKDKSGIITFPMKEVIIQNERGEVLKKYQQDNIYVISGEIIDNQLNMTRVKKNGSSIETKEAKTDTGKVTDGESSSDTTESVNNKENAETQADAENAATEPEEENVVDDSMDIQFSSSLYEAISDDQIMNNVEATPQKNRVETAATENYEKIIQIAVLNTIPTKSLKIQTPKEVLFEGGREIILEKSKDKAKRYYVYGKNGIERIFTKPAAAINLASSISGVVLNENGQYVWKKGNLLTKNQIMKIKPASIENNSSIAVCLDSILSYEGISRNSEYLLQKGDTIYSILNDNLTKNEILMLNGCSLESILYYVNQDIPVLALQDDGNAVLIVGFNELNTVLMDPNTGTIYKKGMNDSAKWFEQNGNSFITYIRQD